MKAVYQLFTEKEMYLLKEAKAKADLTWHDFILLKCLDLELEEIKGEDDNEGEF